MVESISSYAESIIILIIAITIVELILPNSKNKKYVMFVSGIVIMIAVINPVIKFFNSEINLSEEVNKIQETFNSYEKSSYTNYDLDYNIYNAYVRELEVNMKTRLEELGYEILDTKINVDETSYNITNIEMNIKYDDGFVQPIIIDVFKNDSSSKVYEADINKVKEVLASNYGVAKENIKINE